MKTVHLKRKGFVVAIRDSQKPERPHIQVDATVNGRRLRKTFGSYEKAVRTANHWLDCLTAGRSDLTLLDPAVVSLLSRAPGATQVGFLENILALSNTPTVIPENAMLLYDMIAAFTMAQESGGVSPRHLETVRSHTKRLKQAFGSRAIASLTPTELDLYLTNISANLRSRLNHRITLVSLFNYAKRKGWLPEDKKTAAERTERPNTKLAEPEIFTPAELKALLTAANDTRPALIYLVLGAFAGIRSAEILRMTWSCWNAADNTLTLGSEITKTARRRLIVVEPVLAAWLNKLSAAPGVLMVAGVTNLHSLLAPVAARAGVAWKPNALRHSYASYHLALHSNAALTSNNCGHSPRVLETVYLKLTSHTSSQLWFSLFTA